MSSKYGENKIFGNELANRKITDFRLVDCVYPADSEMPRHTHETSHISVVLGGNYTEQFGRKRRDSEISTLILHPPGEDHSVKFYNAGARIFSLHLHSQWVKRVREHTKVLDEPAAFRGLPAALAVRIFREFREANAISALVVESLALELVASAASEQTNSSEKQVPRWLNRVRELLHDRFDENIVFREIAVAVAGVHPVYLAREFRRRFNCTMGEYVRRLRIEKACGEIAATDVPLVEIAASVGFYDQSHFNNHFKRQTKMTPAQFRAAFRLPPH